MTKKLTIPLSIACIAIATWYISFFATFWNGLDLFVFRFLNSLLTSHPYAPSIVRAMNSSIFDWFSDAVMLLLFLPFFSRKEGGSFTHKLAVFLYMALSFAITIALVNKFFFHSYLRFERISPTLALEGVTRITSFFPGMKIKEATTMSFPGDHGTLALLYLVHSLYLLRPSKAFLAAGYALLIVLPRMIVGAHWLSDIAVGSLSIALMSFVVFFATPLFTLGTSKIESFFSFLKHQLKRIKNPNFIVKKNNYGE